jgi:SlyX protein
MNDRITDLEIRFTHQERTIQELSDTIYRQQQEIERMAVELRQIREQLSIAAPSMNRLPEEEEPPPHY